VSDGFMMTFRAKYEMTRLSDEENSWEQAGVLLNRGGMFENGLLSYHSLCIDLVASRYDPAEQTVLAVAAAKGKNEQFA
jgi:hypothetical protein